MFLECAMFSPEKKTMADGFATKNTALPSFKKLHEIYFMEILIAVTPLKDF